MIPETGLRSRELTSHFIVDPKLWRNVKKPARHRPTGLSSIPHSMCEVSERIDIVMTIGLIVQVTCWLTKFLANDIHIARCFDADSNRVGSDTNNRHCDIVTNQNLLAWLSREHQHTATPFLVLKIIPVSRGLNVSHSSTPIHAATSHQCRQLEYDVIRITGCRQENPAQSENSKKNEKSASTSENPGKSLSAWRVWRVFRAFSRKSGRYFAALTRSRLPVTNELGDSTDAVHTFCAERGCLKFAHPSHACFSPTSVGC